LNSQLPKISNEQIYTTYYPTPQRLTETKQHTKPAHTTYHIPIPSEQQYIEEVPFNNNIITTLEHNPTTTDFEPTQVAEQERSQCDEYSTKTVHQGNYNKFNQNPLLLNELNATVCTPLVEASPFDKMWGIGLRQDDPRSQKRETWHTQNKLGQILTELRDEVFLEFQSLAAINFTLEPIQEQETNQVLKQKHTIHQIVQEYGTEPTPPAKEQNNSRSSME